MLQLPISCSMCVIMVTITRHIFITLPTQPQGTVSDSFLSFFLSSLPCRHSRRVLYLTRFFTLPAQPQGTVSDSFLSFFLSCFFLSSFFLSGNTPFSHTSLHPIQTKLGQSDQYLDHYSGSNDDGVRGHDGVNGVKKGHFHQKGIKSYRMRSIDA